MRSFHEIWKHHCHLGQSSQRKKISLYVDVLEELTPLFFALDHVSDAPWMPVYIKDTKSLPFSIKDEFENCSNWILSKTTKMFSVIPFYRRHEQKNNIVKGSGDVTELTETQMLFDVGYYRDQRWPDFWCRLMKNIFLMKKQACRSTVSTMSMVNQHRRSSKDMLPTSHIP